LGNLARKLDVPVKDLIAVGHSILRELSNEMFDEIQAAMED
jgi:hypothetical protein